MRLKSYLCIVAIAAGAATANAQDKPANHLVMSEVVINSIAESATGSSEYVEIFNPTASAVSLDHYFITDQAQFYNFPVFQDAGVVNDIGGGDYILQFPPGHSIPAGGIVVVCWHAKSFVTDFFGGNLANFTGLPGSPQLFETGIGANSDAAVPDMISYNSNADPNAAVNFSHTNGGEFIRLAFWDGRDLVQDVDLVSWGAANATGGDAPQQRGGLASDGPDAGGDLTDYFFDNGIDTRNVDVDPSYDPNSLARRTTIEIGEAGFTGNGHQGQDETTEWCWDTWMGGEGDGGSATDEDNFLTPGLPGGLVTNSEIPVPFIGAVSRSVKDPVPGAAFTITCRAGSVNTPTVQLFLSTNGSAYVAQNMTLNAGTGSYEKSVGPFAAGTYLKYYFQATDGGKTGRYPLNAAGQLFAPYENDFYTLHVRPTPPTDADLIINEIQFNPAGGDNSTNAEWVEIYNSTATPINLSGGHYSDFATNSERCVIPEGAIVPANGYIILTSASALFSNLYPWVETDKVFEMHDIRTDAVPGHNNDADSPMISDANDYRWMNRPTEKLDTTSYQDSSQTGSTWPDMTTTTGAGNSGKTVELKLPTLDNSEGANWAISINSHGSPMAPNQQSNVADWTVY